MNRNYKPHQFPHLITVWRNTGARDIYGRQSREVFTLKCRYEDADRLYINEAGNHVRSRAVIYTPNDDLILGDAVIQGDFSNEESPVNGAFEIKNRRITTNQRNTRTEYRYIF